LTGYQHVSSSLGGLLLSGQSNNSVLICCYVMATKITVAHCMVH